MNLKKIFNPQFLKDVFEKGKKIGRNVLNTYFSNLPKDKNTKANQIKHFKEIISFTKKKWFLEIVWELETHNGLNFNELKRKYFLTTTEMSEIGRNESLTIPLTALEFAKKQEILELIRKYGWNPSPSNFSSEITFTDCKVGSFFNSIINPNWRKAPATRKSPR